MRRFRHPAVVPLRQTSASQFVLELFHGPTLAFKDVAMQLISRLMDHVLAKRSQRTTIVVATSGDTGGAAVEAFANLENVDLIVLFPNGRISEVQRRMMTTSGAANIHALAIEGTFDDCQAIVKAMFNHHNFRDAVALSGVNSINWARIVAQVVYYFTSAVALGAPARTVDFTVPTGNFGDIFAGYVAKRMGLPIRWLRIAANVNDILARTLKTGIYEVREVHATASPSMDIQISSNFERLLFEASRRDADSVRRLMGSLKQSGRFVLPDATLAAIREEFDAGRADETETAAAIRAAWREAGDLVDPHTAVALAVADRDNARFENPQHRAVDRACGQVPRCGRGRLRGAAAIAGLARGPDDQIRTHQGDEKRCCGGRTVRVVGQPRRQAGSSRMSVEITKLPSGLTVDHRCHAASGDRGARRVGRRRRPRRKAQRARHLASARTHGVQGHHAALLARDRRGDRGGRRRSQCRHLDRDHRLLRAGDEGRRAAGARRAVRHPRQSRLSFRTNWSARRA